MVAIAILGDGEKCAQFLNCNLAVTSPCNPSSILGLIPRVLGITMNALRSDDELLSGVSVGTFRWKKNKSFVDLPPPTPTTKFELRGWGGWWKIYKRFVLFPTKSSDRDTRKELVVGS